MAARGKTEFDFEVGVIGAGPGGLVASLYLRRFLRETILVSSGPPRASWIPRTHNLLGYRGGVSGVELLRRLQSQLTDLGIERAVGDFRVQKTRSGFLLTDGQSEFRVKKVVIATGMSDVQPPLDNLVQLRRTGLLRYCPVCDAYEYRNKRLIVLAQDEHGLKTALFLSRFTQKLRVIWPKSERIPLSVAKSCRSIGVEFIEGFAVSARAIETSKARGLSVVVFDEKSDRERVLECDACYVALGVTVNDSAFRELEGLKRTPDGFLLVGSHQEVGVPGVFAVGDCVEGLAQIAVAAGQAAIAATRIHNDLRAERS